MKLTVQKIEDYLIHERFTSRMNFKKRRNVRKYLKALMDMGCDVSDFRIASYNDGVEFVVTHMKGTMRITFAKNGSVSTVGDFSPFDMEIRDLEAPIGEIRG